MIADSDGSRRRYAMLVVAILCQLATVAITWNLWQVRDRPVNLPVYPGLPEISFGWAMVVSLVIAAVLPKFGVPLHWITLVTASALDQFRLEPQFFGLAMLMLAYFGDTGLRISRWYLVAMWIWTGIHKFLSPEWLGHLSWGIVDRAGLPADDLYLPFAIGVAATELTLGLLACFRPRWAAKLCVAVHLGIVAFLSPLFTKMNYSVIPWNIGIAVVGYWILMQIDPTESWLRIERKISVVFRSAKERKKHSFAERKATIDDRPPLSRQLPGWEKAVIGLLMIIPIGFYFGWVDRCFCHVMYSGNLPSGLITTEQGTIKFDSYDELAVPFPHERRLFRLYFARTAQPGEKLHIADQRAMLSDLYFVMGPNGPQPISAEDFFGPARIGLDTKAGQVLGVGIDDPRSLFALSQAGVRMLRSTDQSMVYAAAFTPETFDRQLLPHLKGLPNLQQIQFAGTDIHDADLAELHTLRLLSGLGLSNTKVSDAGLKHLEDLPYLQYVESDGTAITKFQDH